MQLVIHYGLHLLAPAALAWVLFRDDWKRAYVLMLATMLVDLDHLLATPIYDPQRCSVGFHFLHSYYAIAGYAVMLFFKRPWRVLAVGLLFHMATDVLDCWMSGSGEAFGPG